jgi:hypothetical protein
VNPIKTNRSNFVFRGPTLDIGDVWAEVDRSAGVVYVDWQPTEAERAAIGRGKGVVRLGILQFPMPPVSLEVRPDLEVLDTTSPAVPEARS